MEQAQEQVQTPEQPEVVNEPVEQVVEGQGEATTETTEQTQADPNEQFLIKTVVDGQETIFDVRDAEQRKQLQENAQKGFHYNKKMQSLSEWEKANQAQTQFTQGILSDPDTVEILVAKENGLNPASLYGSPQPPDQSLAETNPVLYSQQYFAYQSMMWERQKIKDLAKARGLQQASLNNNSLFEKARIENDLNDVEYNQVKNYMQMNFKPNVYGMFTKEQMDAAVIVITGKARSTQEQLNTIAKIDKSIKNASQPMNVAVKNKTVTAPKKETEKFHEFVRDYVKQK